MSNRFILVLICSMALYIATLSPTVGHGIDDGIHIVAAKALVTGQGLRMISDPASPPATQFPPGLSLCLTPVLYFFPEMPENIIPLQLVSTLFALIFVTLSWFWFNRHVEPSAAFILTCLTALNPETIRFSSAVIAEMGYAAFSVAALLFFERLTSDKASTGWRPLLWFIFALTGAYMFRSVGLALLIAGPGLLILKKRGKAAAVVIAGFFLIASPWLLKSALVGTPEYRSQFWLVSLEDPERGEIGPAGLALRAGHNVVTYSTETIPAHLFTMTGSQRVIEFAEETGTAPVLSALRLFITGMVFLGILIRFRSGPGIVEWYMVVYFGMLLIWHDRIQWKYMAPVTPFLLFYLWTGLTPILSRLAGRISLRRLQYAALTLFFTGYVFRAQDAVASGWLIQGKNDPYAPTYSWIKRETAKDSLLIGFDHPGLFLYTGRKAVAPLMSHDPERVLRYIRETGADYFIVQPRGVSNEQPLLNIQYQRPVLTAYPERFSLVYTDTENHFEVYRIHPDPSPSPS